MKTLALAARNGKGQTLSARAMRCLLIQVGEARIHGRRMTAPKLLRMKREAG